MDNTWSASPVHLTNVHGAVSVNAFDVNDVVTVLPTDGASTWHTTGGVSCGSRPE